MYLRFFMIVLVSWLHATNTVSARSYTIEVYTGDIDYGATDADVFLQIFGSSATTKEFQLTGRNLFNRGSKDTFKITTGNLGSLEVVRIRHDNSWWGAGWFLDKVVITDNNSTSSYEFICYRWLSDNDGDGKIERMILVRNKGPCGLRSSSSRIVNGNISKPNSWPWQAQLGYKGYLHICGGALIDPQWVLTAAHCVEDDLDGKAYQVTMGEHDLNGKEGPEQVIGVRRIVIHKFYDPYDVDNDVALMQLDKPALLTKQVGLVCLPDQDDRVPIGHNCVVSGWGNLWGGGPTPAKLQEATLPTVSNTECEKGNMHIGTISENMLCGGAGGTNNVTSCHGDSGGPFVCPEGGKWKLRGVVSWGEERCIVGTSYDVFVRVSKYTNWILSQISAI